MATCPLCPGRENPSCFPVWEKLLPTVCPPTGDRVPQATRCQVVRTGEAHIQAEPARGDDAGQRWNIHAHAIVELGCAMVDVDLTGLQAMWTEVLTRIHGRGSLDLRQRRNLRPEFFNNGNRAVSSCRKLRGAQATQ